MCTWRTMQGIIQNDKIGNEVLQYMIEDRTLMESIKKR